MYFKEIFLDDIYKQTFDQISIRENWITCRSDYDLLLPSDRVSRRIHNKEKVLLLLTLFENVDMPLSQYNLGPFINTGLINEKSTTLDEKAKPYIATYSDLKDNTDLKRNDRQRAIYSRKTAFEIVRQNEDNFINRLFRNYKYNFPERHKYDRIPSKKEIRNIISELIDSYEEDGSINEQYISKGNFYSYIDSELCFWGEGNIEGIYKSLKGDCVFGNSFAGRIDTDGKKNRKEIIEDISIIGQTMLKNEIAILPAPKNIDEVFRMREKKEIVSFREVLSAWIDTLHKGEHYLEAKLRKDIARANKELKTLERWKKFETSPINFWLNSIGGHIPILSSILTVVYTLSGAYDYRTTKKNDWVMLLK